jgi:hypothetical protein
MEYYFPSAHFTPKLLLMTGAVIDIFFAAGDALRGCPRITRKAEP